ncbi:MAG: Uma2 family endonuclease [Oscillospiraceae bacterium]|nr:Uma2 family endonuclease [Oscillospiraceae bacterium]
MNKDDELKVEEGAVDYSYMYYSVEEYEEICKKGTQAELHDGLLVVLETPTIKHQILSNNLFSKLSVFLEGKKCKAFHSSLGVRLDKNGKSFYIPDIAVVCDKSKFTETRYVGAPEFIIEVLSPSTAKTDKVRKFNEYQKAGVREYWIVEPETNLLQVNILTKDGYLTKVYDEVDTAVPVTVLQGCVINLADVFDDDWLR